MRGEQNRTKCSRDVMSVILHSPPFRVVPFANRNENV
jgi:hypothetical protein